jgi:hypothetical protein
MSELLLERPPEAMITPEAAEVPRVYGVTEKAVGDVAIHGSGLAEQLSIENEPGVQWPVTNAEKGIVPSVVPESNYYHPPDMSPIEEARHTIRTVEHDKAHNEWTSKKIDWAEFNKRTRDKTPRTYQQPLLKQDGQVFEQEGPTIDVSPDKGVAAPDGSFWHGSNQLMEPGDRVLPSGEVPDSVHEANKTDRIFNSGSSPMNEMGYDKKRGAEKDFAFGYQRELGVLPTPYGEHIYKVSSPNSKIVATNNGEEVWAEGGGTVEKRMHPDFAYNYAEARHRVNNDQFYQSGLPGMENGLQFVPEEDLDVSYKEFYEKHLQDTKQDTLRNAQLPTSGPEDVALPGLEQHGKRPDIPVAPADSSGTPLM